MGRVTLLLGINTRTAAILVSDRRITSVGVVRDDEFNKTLSLICDDGRYAVAFAGLATSGTHSTGKWLAETLAAQSAGDVGTSVAVFDRLTVAATKLVAGLGLAGLSDGRLSVLAVGYRASGGRVEAVTTLMSNFEDFGADSEPVSRPGFMRTERVETGFAINAVGMYRSADVSDWEDIRDMVRTDPPAQAIVRKTFARVRAIAKRKASAGLIGEQLMGIIVPRDPTETMHSEYDVAVPGETAYGAGHVDARTGRAMAFWDVGQRMLDADGKPIRMALPRVGRNDPCPCGSGIKYKKCHIGQGSGQDSGWHVVLGSD